MHRFFSLAACSSFAVAFLASVVVADVVQYELVFDATWSESSHPTAYHENAHFSGVRGVTHTQDFALWSLGELATPGVQLVAERGIDADLQVEIDAAIAAGTADQRVAASGTVSPGISSGRFNANSSHPLISFVTMIAPSPDWFVGVANVELMDERRKWRSEITFEAIPYDAGTDSGVDFGSGDVATVPHEPIFEISAARFAGTPPLGTFTLRLTTLLGDLDGSGALDVGDVDVLCYRLGESHPRLELTDDDAIGIDDVLALVERYMETRPGDTNLDGAVNFADFLALASHFGNSADWTGGDFDCNRQIDFADFLVMSEHFGFERNTAGAAASVPEPANMAIAFVPIALLVRASIRKRSRRG